MKKRPYARPELVELDVCQPCKLALVEAIKRGHTVTMHAVLCDPCRSKNAKPLGGAP